MGGRPPGDGSGGPPAVSGRRARSDQIEPNRTARGSSAPVDDDMADIEELLRRRGIT
jgi:hypothetical protein